MEIVINKTRKIKEIIGTVLAEKGFKYIRCERRLETVIIFKKNSIITHYIHSSNCFAISCLGTN